MIELYEVQIIFSYRDFGVQADKLSKKINDDEKCVKTKQDKKNMLVNKANLESLKIEDVFYKSTSTRDIIYYEEAEPCGWFILPYSGKIILDSTAKSIDEYYTEVYDKYFDQTFDFLFENEKLNDFYKQSIESYKHQLYFPCVCSLFSIIENLNKSMSKSDISQTNFKSKNGLENIGIKLSNIRKENTKIVKFINEKFIRLKSHMEDNYYKATAEKEEEPYIINRNRILHGIFTRNVDKSDCLKLFHMVRNFHYINYLFTANDKYNSLLNEIKMFEDKKE